MRRLLWERAAIDQIGQKKLTADGWALEASMQTRAMTSREGFIVAVVGVGMRVMPAS